MPNVYTMFFYTLIALLGQFLERTQKPMLPNRCIYWVWINVYYTCIYNIYILYSTSRYANMVYEVYTIHIYSRLSHELEGKKHIKKYINNH